MLRPFRALVLGVAMLLATLGPAAAPVAAAPVPPLPDSMAAIEDSITQAVDVCCLYGNWPGHSWSTGYVPLDVVSKLDWFHPSLRGQAALAALTWERSWWGA
jgi:hypothetical protein